MRIQDLKSRKVNERNPIRGKIHYFIMFMYVYMYIYIFVMSIVQATALIFISGRGSAISFAQEGRSGN